MPFGPVSADQVGELRQVTGVGVEGGGGQDGLLPALDFVGYLGPGADQGHVLDQLEGDGGDGALAVAGQVEVLDLFGFGLVAHPDEDLVVEVDPAGAHAADVQGQRGPDLVGGALEVVVLDDGHRAAAHVEGLRRVPGAGAGEAFGQGGGVEVVHGGREEDDVPAVGDLGRQGHVLGALGAQVDRDL